MRTAKMRRVDLAAKDAALLTICGTVKMPFQSREASEEAIKRIP